MKAVGDVTGDQRPEIFLRTGDTFWVLVGYRPPARSRYTRHSSRVRVAHALLIRNAVGSGLLTVRE